jgi:hypothetical protein
MMPKKKDVLLGMPYGTAMNRLKKAIMFSLVTELKRNICHRCGKPIATAEELSVEHIDSWQLSDDPVKVFFDLSKIAFSHLLCNAAAALRYKIHDHPRGSQRIYDRKHQARRLRQRDQWRDARRAAGLPYT